MTNNPSKPKLSLTRETLVKLTPDHLEGVVGGLGDIHATASCCLWNSCVNQPPPPAPKTR
jgi:hypothetical protein